MTLPPPDGSRDRRIEDLTNLWLIHPAARWALPHALAHRVSANAVSVAGLGIGIAAALCYEHWADPRWCVVGLLLSAAWLMADGLDGMVARATRTASQVGRFLDGACDHGVFILIYVALAGSIATADTWALAFAAGGAHVVQSMLYEGERTRFHRRMRGEPPSIERVPIYDSIAGVFDRLSDGFDAALRHAPVERGAVYSDCAVPALRLLATQSANVRVWAIFLACAIGNPRLFWWFELVPLSLLLAAGLVWHRRIEARLLARWERRGVDPSAALAEP